MCFTLSAWRAPREQERAAQQQRMSTSHLCIQQKQPRACQYAVAACNRARAKSSAIEVYTCAAGAGLFCF